jgi:RNA polymerase sigma-70 factor (ECF subfamily)
MPRTTPDGGSLSLLLDRWREGDQSAAFEIYERYYKHVVALARYEIGSLLRQVVTAEDVAHSVLGSLIRRIADDGYGPDSTGSLSAPIKKITKNKVRKLWEYWTAKKRDIRRMIWADPLPEPASRGLVKETSIVLADMLEHIRKILPEDLFEIVSLQLEGLEDSDIAVRLGVSFRTVKRKQEQLQDIWRKLSRSRDMS